MLSFVETLLQDIRYGLRQLGRSPGFTATTVFTLALGLGATTAIFSIVDAVLLHNTPYQNPAQLVEIGNRNPQGESELVPAGDFNDWQQQNQAFQGLAAYQRNEFRTLTGAGDPDEVWVSPVSTNLFQLLGVNASLGRTFASNETSTVVVSREYWRSHFASDKRVIGAKLELDGQPYAVIGVAPEGFGFPDPRIQMWTPLTLTAAEKADHEQESFNVIARLKPAVALAQAQAAMDVVARRLALQHPKTNAGFTAPVTPFEAPRVGGVLRAGTFALLGAVVFVLLIVCTNVASMLLARGATRQTEMGIRAALGAGRWRLIRQLVIESVSLAGAASVAGVGLAWLGLRLITRLVPEHTIVDPHALERIGINLPVLAFAVAFSLLTGLAVGLLPALRASSLDLNESLKGNARMGGTSARGSRLQGALVACEVALALVLLVGAGLLVQSFERLTRAPTGFVPDHTLTVRVPLLKYKYAPGVQSTRFYQEVLQRIRALPGVESVGMANNLPFTGFHTTVVLPLPGSTPAEPGRTIGVTERTVSAGYFQALGIPLRAGREFTPADYEPGARCVRIINQAMAGQYWSGETALGKELYGACPKNAPALIVGIVADSKQNTVDSQPEPELFEPYAQHAGFATFLITFVIRTHGSPIGLAGPVRRAIWEVDPDQPAIEMRTMEGVISDSLWQQRFSASVLGVFASIALMLSAVGIFGVLSYAVSRRTHEIGIRAALGATRRDILQLVVGEGLLLTLIGVAGGVIAALGLTRLLASLLYGVRPADPATFGGVAVLLVVVALLAAYLPARRASKVDPMVALRYE
ncbi:MAG TPA: ABC transporter permease [Terriglobia bacterium]|nr:ABC transporter permease [Terriglobia bacterium]